MIQDFSSSGLMEMAAEKHRVIAFDRPGFGHSARPSGTIWTPAAQAELIHGALEQIGITRAKVLGHSWGASVAVALALEYPETVAGSILESGYYYPTPRADVLLLSGPATPVVGDPLSHTVSPILGRLLAACYAQDLRPSEGASQVSELPERDGSSSITDPRERCRDGSDDPKRLGPAWKIHRPGRCRVVIIAGEQDRLIDIEAQSARLHLEGTRVRRVTMPAPRRVKLDGLVRGPSTEPDRRKRMTRNKFRVVAHTGFQGWRHRTRELYLAREASFSKLIKGYA